MNTLNDLKYTLRLLKKTPVFSLICLLVVTFGVAIVLILFSFVKNTYFQEMPFVNGDRFVAIKQAQKESGRENDALPMNGFAFNAIKNGTHSFETLGAFQSFPTIVSDIGTSGRSAEMYLAAKIMPNLLAATTVNPISGRLLHDEDTGIDTVRVVLISYRLWQNYYLGDLDIIGKKTRMNAEPYIIVGVMPEGYAYPTNYDLWFPLAIPSAAAVEEPAIYLAVGVLSRDSNLASATADVKNVLAQLRERNPTIYNLLYGAVTIHARHTQDSNNGTPELLGGMALIIVLLVCVNLSSLFLVRANTRMQELAIRNAVGAGRWQIFTQVLTESLILCVIGSMLGVLIADTAMQLLQGYAEGLVTKLTQRPFWQDLTPDSTGITFVVFLTLTIWLLSGSFCGDQGIA
ncbi:MAG: ABC transporter permease [bacterium]|nr:FtsX-like permease family protein [Gammaproteobacteria bacterium]HIL94546.1 FtsX-like permease family protein [Pseudomonadales bacterium]